MFTNRLKSARLNAGLSQKEISAKIFISQQAYAKYETGTATPNPETLCKIAETLNVSADYLLGNDLPSKSEKSKKIPVLGHVAAGIPIEAITDILDYEEITEEMASAGDYFALRIKGDSMEPKISDGDVVIVRKQESVESGQTAIILVNGDDAVCKKFVKHTNGISLISSNPAYSPMFYTPEEVKNKPIRIIGRVVELRAKF